MYTIIKSIANIFLLNSMGTFLSAYEDENGVLHAIEEKIAKATKIPRHHFEVLNHNKANYNYREINRGE